MIFEWSKMEKLTNMNYQQDNNYDMPIFCEKHRVIGALAFRQGGNDSLQQEKKLRKPSSKKPQEP